MNGNGRQDDVFVLVKVAIDMCVKKKSVHICILSLSLSLSHTHTHTHTPNVHCRAGPTAAVMNAARMQNALLGQQATPAVNPGSGVAALMSKILH